MDEHLAYLAERYPDEPYRLYAAQLSADLAAASAGDMIARLNGISSPPLRMRQMSNLLEPLSLMDRTLRRSGMTDIANGDLENTFIRPTSLACTLPGWIFASTANTTRPSWMNSSAA